MRGLIVVLTLAALLLEAPNAAAAPLGSCPGQAFHFHVPATWHVDSGSCHNGSPMYAAPDSRAFITMYAEPHPLFTLDQSVAFLISATQLPAKSIQHSVRAINGHLYHVAGAVGQYPRTSSRKIDVSVTVAGTSWRGGVYAMIVLIRADALAIDTPQAMAGLASLTLH